MCCTTHWLKCLHERVISSACSSLCSFPCVSPILSSSTWTLTCTSSFMWSTPGRSGTGTPPTEESGPLDENTPFTRYEPKLPDDFHYSETTEIFFRDESSDTVPSYLFDAELDDETIGHCSFRSEKNQRTVDKLITLLKKVCCQLSHFSVCHSRTVRPVH